MSTIQASNKAMQNKLYSLIESMAEHYGFDADDAFDNVIDVSPFMVSEPKEEKPIEDKNSTLEKTRHNVELWQKKLDGDKFKDEDAKLKHIAKLDKEKAKLQKLEPKVEPKVEPKKSAKAEPKAKSKETEEKEKRIKRMSPTLAAQLKTALESQKVEITDKLKKDFVKYVDDLTDDDFKAQGLTDHMRDFAQLSTPSTTPVAEVVGAGSGLVVGDAPVIDLDISELQEIEMLASVDPPGTYWDSSNGRFVRGPSGDEDGDVDEVQFEGKTYAVSTNGLVYLEINDKDVFQGHIGVGKFKNMTR